MKKSVDFQWTILFFHHRWSSLLQSSVGRMDKNSDGTVATTTMAIRPVSRGMDWTAPAIWPDAPPTFSDVIHIVLDLHQQILQWIQVVTLDIEEGVEPVIPEPKAVNKLMVAIPGRDNGKQIWKKIRVSLAPSIRADSRMASGMVRLKKVRIKMMLNGLRKHWDNQRPNGIS